MDKQSLDFSEIDGQLELVMEHLERKERKRSVSYSFNESTIERVKEYAQRYQMKDSEFVEEVLLKLMDTLEAKGTLTRRDEAGGVRPCNRQVTPWGRLTKQIERDKNKEQLEYCEEDGSVKEVEQEIKQEAKQEKPVVPHNTPDEQELVRLEKDLTEYIFQNFKPDYRILYQRFEKQVQHNLNIDSGVLANLIVRLSKRGELTFYSHQNLLDINKKIFEDRMPEDRGNSTNYYNDVAMYEE